MSSILDNNPTPLTDPAGRQATLGGDRLRPWQAPVRWLLSKVERGRLSLSLPDGTCIEARGALPGPHADLHLTSWRGLLRLVAEGDLGLAFGYREGDWTSSDLTALLSFGLANEAALGRTLQTRGLARWVARRVHRAHANTRRGSRENISFHYDLGNEFYRQWLDPSMLYSSAMFGELDPAETLEAAQTRRLDRIVEWLDVPESDATVLEIGFGWGTLATELAARRGAKVTGLTLSTEQLAFAQQLVDQRGLADRVDLKLMDYRDATGSFDRIVSIEMIEAVGERYWPVYFRTLADRLAADGVAVLQAITIDEAHFEHYRGTPDFIQRCVFPGGMLPTPERIAAEAARVGLKVTRVERFGMSYARTLAEWRERFLKQWPEIQALGKPFDARFMRLWEYYLCYCEAGFRAGRVDVGLYRLER